MQNAKLNLLLQTPGAMLNTPSQLLRVHRTGPKAVKVQNTDRILLCERVHLLCLTFCYAERKPYPSLFTKVPVHKLHGLDLSVPVVPLIRRSKKKDLPRALELRNATSGIRTLDCRLKFYRAF
jgi:hypothetical protein